MTPSTAWGKQTPLVEKLSQQLQNLTRKNVSRTNSETLQNDIFFHLSYAFEYIGNVQFMKKNKGISNMNKLINI